MTDHLPECDMEIWMQEQMDDPYAPHWLEPPDDIECQCKKLRACEERVRESWYEVQSETWMQGFRYALNAAREAVAATFIGWCKDYMNCTDYEHVCGKRREIIAAIDALKEKK